MLHFDITCPSCGKYAKRSYQKVESIIEVYRGKNERCSSLLRTEYSDKVTWLGVAVNDEIVIPATFKGNYFYNL